MTKYYFTRHGESQANIDRVFAGVMDSPLTEKGRRSAEAEGRRLAEAGCTYDLIISSPLSRAVETAQIIAAETNCKEPIIIESLLLERSFGDLAGRPWNSIIDETSDSIIKAGGESIDAMEKRVSLAIGKIQELSAGKKSVLLVGHGTWYQMAATILSGKAGETFLEADNLPNNQVVKLIGMR